jgi:hypothetical protein
LFKLFIAFEERVSFVRGTREEADMNARIIEN